jgi:hypothetical protein
MTYFVTDIEADGPVPGNQRHAQPGRDCRF